MTSPGAGKIQLVDPTAKYSINKQILIWDPCLEAVRKTEKQKSYAPYSSEDLLYDLQQASVCEPNSSHL